MKRSSVAQSLARLEKKVSRLAVLVCLVLLSFGPFVGPGIISNLLTLQKKELKWRLRLLHP